ncbi:MAG: AraC family transcriptional regulator [Clostridiales bacterium]|nr:AraC family transcriptional regulator [Clostridiales bacterium]
MHEDLIILDRFSHPFIKLRYAEIAPTKRELIEHHHTECEIALFMSGTGVYRVGDKNYDIAPGDIFLFATNESHFITDINGFSYIRLHFEPRILWLDNNFSDPVFLKIFFDRNENFENRLDRSNPHAKMLCDLIISLYEEMKSKKTAYTAAVKILLDSIFLTLIRDYGFVNQNSAYTADTGALKRLEKAMKFIDTNLESDLSLSEIAKTALMSKNYFCTIFKRFNGISPWDYITIKRIEKAVELLKTTDMSKLEIAYTCGFNSPSNFYKAFRRITGKAPGDIT